MEAIEAAFPPLANQLPKDYERFADDLLERMLRTFDAEGLRDASGDVFGRTHDRLLDIVENFTLFDESKPGATRKVIARNHQVLGVRAVESVIRPEGLKKQFPIGERLRHRVIQLPLNHERWRQ